MKKLLEEIDSRLSKAFESCGYDPKYGVSTVSNRPDLCEFQCNGAMAAAKQYRKAPFMIADDVVAQLADQECFSSIESVKPGFINIKISEEYLAGYLNEMRESDRFGIEGNVNPKKVFIDYGGPNVAKPLHVGHLRSAIIGESIKRIFRFMGDEVTGDVHMGDWGLQMGLIISELKSREPELCYFDESFDGEYPKEAPFTISELEEIYPAASARSKEDKEFYEEALEATKRLQEGDRGYRAIWNHIIDVSVTDLKKNYEKLNVDFDLWNGESTVQNLIAPMVERLKSEGFAHYDQGALVVDVKEPEDTKEIPPCMILKSNGSALYNTTDLATLVMRAEEDPDEVIYVVDNRQSLYFTQVFRCAKKTGIVSDKTRLRFLGFGTMNGKDGKPFKTRSGGVMRLENLIRDINDEMLAKISANEAIDRDEAVKTAEIIGLSAIKYGDLQNQASKDYVFDIDRFTSFEGNSGPYLLYTIVRIKSIIKKAKDQGIFGGTGAKILPAHGNGEKELMLALAKVSDYIEAAYKELAPHKICAFLYDTANAFNRFYHETKILVESDEAVRNSYLNLLVLTEDIMNTCIDLLGFSAPDRM